MTRLSSRVLILLLICCMAGLLFTGATAADSLTRGSMFTVSIAAKPNTAYYVWFARTFSMSGEPGDQPPVIVANTVRVEFDPDGGPYVIGSYRINNGNGRTILDDVAPSSATTSNTRYYAKVTTDEDGFGIIQFSTSSATAPKTFSIRAENPASPGEEVPVRLGLPEKKGLTVNVPTTRHPTTPPFPPVTPSTPLPTVSTTTVPAAPPGFSPIPATTKQAPADIMAPLAAIGTCILLARRVP